jgi:hypothetical protein
VTAPAWVTISATIENTYELYADVTTYEVGVVVPAPPADETSDAYMVWGQEHIAALTGTGRPRGDAWYDVTITASTDPALLGRDFAFGY